MRATSVYIIQESGGKALKIGIGYEPNGRLKDLQTGNPRALRLAFVRNFHTKDYARKVEFMAHALLVDRRLKSEWFATSLAHAVTAIEDAIVYTDDFLSRCSGAQVANDP